MGYSYGRGPSGRWVLVCDGCGRADGTSRKVRCPWNYCPAAALCASCRSVLPLRIFGEGTRPRLFMERSGPVRWASRDLHRLMGCEEGHRRFEADRQRERDLVAEGRYLRHSALVTRATDPRTGEIIVQVVFANAPWGHMGPECWALMRQSTYDALPVGKTATLEDFQAVGEVVAGPVGYQLHERTTVEAIAEAWARGAAPVPTVATGGTTKEVVVA